MSVAVLPSPAFKTGGAGSLGGEAARKKHGKLPFVVDAEPVEVTISSEVETEIIAEANVATEEAAAQAEHVEWETEEVLSPEDLVECDDEYDDDDAEDSDYVPEDEDDDDELDEDEYLRSLQLELDDSADDVKDLYLKQMLAARDRGDTEDAAFVDRYIQAQESWKRKHGSSIDEYDLDLRLGASLQDGATLDIDDGAATQAFWRVWNGRIASWLPAALRYRRQEVVLSVLGAVLFVALALGIQFHELFHAAALWRS